ncbi:MAG: phosphonate metabolism transcriptional regulator PhnF [Sulfuritalea sp.]|nr:phosphonate metabolism transcriptional regulator PhnF [Sulfuritalea sp.]
MIQRGSGVAVWWQIVQSIEKDIAAKHYKPGERLPSEAELAERFAVNRHTIRRAVSELEHRGLVRVEQGRGIFLQEYAIRYSLGKRTRFSENLRSQQLDASMRVLQSKELNASGRVAGALGLAPGEPVLLIETLGEADGQPILHSSHYYPAGRFPGLAEALAKTGSVTAALRQQGVADYERVESLITARLPDETVARLLLLPRSQPILQVEGVNVDSQGRRIEFCVTRFAGDAVQLMVNDH